MSEDRSRTQIVVVKQGRSSADLPGEVVILNEEQGGYFGLSGVGARVWKLIQRPQTIEKIVNTLIREYDVDRQRCRRDVEELLEDMASSGLVAFKNETAD